MQWHVQDCFRFSSPSFSHQLLSDVESSDVCWFTVNSVPEEENVPPLSHRESSVQSWCVGVKREWQKSKYQRGPYRVFLWTLETVRLQCNMLLYQLVSLNIIVCVCVFVWAQPGNFLLCESLVVQWTHPHTLWRCLWFGWVISVSSLPLIGFRASEMMQQTSPCVHIWTWFVGMASADSKWTL